MTRTETSLVVLVTHFQQNEKLKFADVFPLNDLTWPATGRMSPFFNQWTSGTGSPVPPHASVTLVAPSRTIYSFGGGGRIREGGADGRREGRREGGRREEGEMEGGREKWREDGREGRVGRWERGIKERRKGGKVGGKEGRQGRRDSFSKKGQIFSICGGAVMVLLTVHSEEGGVVGGGACLVRRRDVAVVVSLV